ncbi:L,D-transpeptidase/peptidoglycan binding protein [Conexibacter sp. SYSU D00693]|uniref:L,D-transpeptidase family protein n=1 Tax=Conexibacter sp. SYSU D00693 TaxID=2812560 RepID=UPI00196AFC0A|nr:L,D-transpeptidase/peptidoglycan binding protein [Conexibacter sp. SYSU D00693]
MRRSPLLSVAVVGALVLAATAALIVYDHSRRDTLAKGVKVAGVDVGGLDREQAIRRLQERVVDRLRQPVRVDHGNLHWILGPREARLSTNVVASVDHALDVSREGTVLSRSWRGLTGGSKDVDLQPEVRYSKAAVVRLLDKVRKEVDRPRQDATVRFTASGPRKVPGRAGLEVEASALHRQLRQALVSTTAPRRMSAHTRKVAPRVSTDELEERYGTVLYANRSSFKLVLYKRLKPVKTYGIAVGQVGMDTPAGLYKIQNKAVNPAWNVPMSDWAGSLAGQVIPGGAPNNPLKARWMGIYDGAGIHGTSDEGSIGSAASHGCIRMRVADVIDLYDRVPVGAPIYIA